MKKGGANFVEEYLGDLEKSVTKKLKDKTKEKEQLRSYKFCYADVEQGFCVDTVIKEGHPRFVIWDGKKYTFADEVPLVTTEILTVPPVTNKFYRGIYNRVIIPNKIVSSPVLDQDVDAAIDTFLKRRILIDPEQYIILRNWVKQTWVYERFNKNPYLYIYGDFGTGKSQLGRYLMMISHYGYVLDSATPSSMGRTMDMTNCSIMLEEAEYLEGENSDKVRSMLRNGYERGGFYQITEQEAVKRFTPTVYLVDQPKIIIKRQRTKDDALSSRTIPIQMKVRDQEVPREMRTDVEVGQNKLLKAQATDVVNILLRWRWQNIFLQSDAPIIDDMNIRFNDTMMPLMKVCTPEDKPILVNYLRTLQRQTIASISDEYQLQVVKILVSIWRKYKGMFGPTTRLFIKDVVSGAIEEYGGEMTEGDAKRIFNSRAIKRALGNLGFVIEVHRNNNYITQETLSDILPRICRKYNIPLEDKEEDEEETTKLSARAEELAKDAGLEGII